jgi:O-antigen/teichoic acid export membrane protein
MRSGLPFVFAGLVGHVREAGAEIVGQAPPVRRESGGTHPVVCSPGSMSSAARASALMLAARASLLGLGFGNTVLTARLLQPEGRGAYATIMAVLGLFTLGVGSLGTGVALSAAHDAPDARRRTTTGSIGIAGTVGLLPVLALLAWQPAASWHGPAVTAALSTPFVLLTTSAQFACMGSSRLGWFGLLQVLQPGLLVAVGAALMIVLRLGLTGAMLAWTLSWLATAAAGAWALLALGWRLRLSELPPWRADRLVRFGVGAAVYGALTYFTNRSVLLLVQGVLGLASAGIFSVAVTLAEPVSNMSVALSSAAYPRLVSPAARPREARRFVQVALLVAAFSAAGIFGLAVLLLVPIFGGAYRQAIGPLPALLLAYVVLSGREIAVLWYVHEQKSYAQPIRASLVAFGVTIAVALALVPRLGTVGAACGAVAGALVLMAILLDGLRRRGLPPLSLLVPEQSLVGPVATVMQRLGLHRLALRVSEVAAERSQP